jgi:hypothetical protein
MTTQPIFHLNNQQLDLAQVLIQKYNWTPTPVTPEPDPSDEDINRHFVYHNPYYPTYVNVQLAGTEIRINQGANRHHFTWEKLLKFLELEDKRYITFNK